MRTQNALLLSSKVLQMALQLYILFWMTNGLGSYKNT